jgi:hypothetical protein
MEAKVLAAILAFAVLVGIGIGWQLPRREASPATLERVMTVTATSEKTVTWTVYEGAMKTFTIIATTVTETVTKPLGPLLKLLLPAATYVCNVSSLFVTVSVVNAGDESADIDFGKASIGLKGVSEERRTVLGPGLLWNQTTLLPGQSAQFNMVFKVVDDAELSKYVRRSQFGTPIISLNLTIPYSWDGGSSELKLEKVFLGVLGGCEPEFLKHLPEPSSESEQEHAG